MGNGKIIFAHKYREEQSGDNGMSRDVLNLDLWNKVQETDPKHTKAFNRGGGFKGTSINPTYNNKKATEMFGPLGIGWGIDVVKSTFQEGGPIILNGKEVCKEITHIIEISLWYKKDGEIGRVPSFGQTSYVGSNKNGVYTDEEAPKKSLTDATTKALSMLGFSADVFLGMYDDVKYVNDIKEANEYDIEAEYQLCIKQIAAMQLKTEFVKMWNSPESKSRRAKINSINQAYYAEINARMKERMKVFEEDEKRLLKEFEAA